MNGNIVNNCALTEQKYFAIFTIMALAIQPIPVLRGKEADDFARKIDYNETHNSGKINFTKQKEMLKSILDNAKL